MRPGLKRFSKSVKLNASESPNFYLNGLPSPGSLVRCRGMCRISDECNTLVDEGFDLREVEYTPYGRILDFLYMRCPVRSLSFTKRAREMLYL